MLMIIIIMIIFGIYSSPRIGCDKSKSQ